MKVRTREEALELLHEDTASESLRKHAYAVEAAMRAYARRSGGDEEQWGLTGLLHDFDHERWPEPPDHTQKGAPVLRERGVPGAVIRAILSHAEWNEIPGESPMEKPLFAVGELAGFVTAVAYVRPSKKLADVDVAAVKKKMKDKGVPVTIGTIRRIIRDSGFKWRNAKKKLTSNDPNYEEKVEKVQHILSHLGPNERFFSIDEYGPDTAGEFRSGDQPREP